MTNFDPRVDRRTFVGGASALGAAASGLVLPRSARAQEPKQGGRFRLGLAHGSTTDSLDPGTFENDFTIQLCYCIHNHLTEIDNRNRLQSELVESYEASDDAKTWRFTLKPGLTFHNGASVTAADVVASFDHHRREDSTSAAKALVDPIVQMTAEDERVVVFELENGNADFPYIVSDYHLAIMPSADGKVDPTSPVGCGPFVLQDFEPGVRASFTKFQDYHKEGKPHFDEIEMIAIFDSAARSNALTTGEVDCIDAVDLKTVHLMRRNPDIRVEATTGTRHFTFPMDVRAAPFDDNNVRLALKYGIDREVLVETILNGQGVVGNDHPIGQSQRYFNTELEQKAYDPERAKFHLRAAGLDSLPVTIHAADAAFAGAIDAATLYREQAAPAGIEIEIAREPDDGYWSNVWMVKPWSMSYWGGRPTEDWMFTTVYAAGANWNETFWDNPRFNELLVQARAELDEDKRREMYWEMQALCSEEGGAIVPMFANYVFAVRENVMNEGTYASNWDRDGHKGVERWWFA